MKDVIAVEVKRSVTFGDYHCITHQAPFFGELKFFVFNAYKETYGANITYFHKSFLYQVTETGAIHGAVGFSPAIARESLFLEKYLSSPVEQRISQLVGSQVERSKIAEVGNLATRSRGGGRDLFANLSEQLYYEGYEWVVFTATRMVRNIFRHMCDCAMEIQAIDESQILELKTQWGCYYDNSPVVMAVPVEEFYFHISALAKVSA